MYKTIRHGENSLQYTILPQHDESAAAAASAAAGLAAAGAPKGIWPPTFIPPQSGDLEPGMVIRAGSRKRSCLAYFGLVIVVSIMLGAIVVPVVLTTNFVSSGAGKGLKWYWPPASSASSSPSVAVSVPSSMSVLPGLVSMAVSSAKSAAPQAAATPAQPVVVHLSTDSGIVEVNVNALLHRAGGGVSPTDVSDTTRPVAIRDDDDDDYLLDDASLPNGVADGGKVFNDNAPLADAMNGADDGISASLRTAIASTTTTTTAWVAATAGPPQAPVAPNIPGRKLRKPKGSRQHTIGAANRKAHATATATATTTLATMTTSLLMAVSTGPPAVGGDDVAAAPVITAGGQRNWISAHWPIGDGDVTANAPGTASLWQNTVSRWCNG